MQPIFRTAFGALLVLCGAADAAAEQEWSHGDWHASKNGNFCAIWTGSDGKGTFSIELDTGGFDASATYLPVWYRGHTAPLRLNDRIALVIDDHETWLSEEMGMVDGEDEWGEYYVAASLTAGFVPELIDVLKRSDRLDVRRRRSGGETVTIDDFSLRGFTATLLKIAEWCRFDPADLPTS
ncbi:MAG: hypothetical protein AAFX81_18020 [Pseudomonadota bacterium]